MVQHSHPYMTTGKTIALTFVGKVCKTFVGKTFVYKTFVGKVMSRFVIAFLPRSKRLLISWLQSPFLVIFEVIVQCNRHSQNTHCVWPCALRPWAPSCLVRRRDRNSRSTRWWVLWSCMDVRVGLWRKLSAEEFMLLKCGVGEDSWESLGLQGDPNSPS